MSEDKWLYMFGGYVKNGVRRNSAAVTETVAGLSITSTSIDDVHRCKVGNNTRPPFNLLPTQWIQALEVLSVHLHQSPYFVLISIPNPICRWFFFFYHQSPSRMHNLFNEQISFLVLDYCDIVTFFLIINCGKQIQVNNVMSQN